MQLGSLRSVCLTLLLVAPACSHRASSPGAPAAARATTTTPAAGIASAAAIASAPPPAAASAPAPAAVSDAEAKSESGQDDEGDETPIKQSDLPAPVQATVAVQAKGAKIHGLSKETEDGRLNYELELVLADGHRKDLDINAAGTVTEIEEEVVMSSLPPAVQNAIHANAGSRKVVRIERVSKGDGTLRGYEIGLRDGAARSELHLGPDGKAQRGEADED